MTEEVNRRGTDNKVTDSKYMFTAAPVFLFREPE